MQLAEERLAALEEKAYPIWRLGRDLIETSVGKTGWAVTSKNASLVGGFGAAATEVLMATCPASVVKIGVQDRWVSSGGIDAVLAQHRTRSADIVEAAKYVMDWAR